MSWEIEETLEQQAEQSKRYKEFLIKESWVKCPRCLAPLHMHQLGATWLASCYCETPPTFDGYEVRNV